MLFRSEDLTENLARLKARQLAEAELVEEGFHCGFVELACRGAWLAGACYDQLSRGQGVRQ